MLLFSCAVSSAQAAPPNDWAHTVKLNNGVAMPLISLGTWQYSPAVAESTVRLGLSLGYNHIDAALDYKNQRSVGKALAEHDRASYFLTTKVPSRTSASSAFADTSKDLAADLEQLGLSYVDLMLVHFPPVGNTLHCAAMQEQWRALETFYRAKKAPRHRRRISLHTDALTADCPVEGAVSWRVHGADYGVQQGISTGHLECTTAASRPHLVTHLGRISAASRPHLGQQRRPNHCQCATSSVTIECGDRRAPSA